MATRHIGDLLETGLLVERHPTNTQGLQGIAHLVGSVEDHPSHVFSMLSMRSTCLPFLHSRVTLLRFQQKYAHDQWQQKIIEPFDEYCIAKEMPLLDRRISLFHQSFPHERAAFKVKKLAELLIRQASQLPKEAQEEEGIADLTARVSKVAKLVRRQYGSHIFGCMLFPSMAQESHLYKVPDEMYSDILHSMQALDAFIQRKQLEYWSLLATEVGYESAVKPFPIDLFIDELKRNKPMLGQALIFAVNNFSARWPGGHFEVLQHLLNTCGRDILKEKDGLVIFAQLLSHAVEAKNIDSIIVLLHFLEELAAEGKLSAKDFTKIFSATYQKVWQHAIATKDTSLTHHLITCKNTFIFSCNVDIVNYTPNQFYSAHIVPFLVTLNNEVLIQTIIDYCHNVTRQTLGLLLPFIEEAANQHTEDSPKSKIFRKVIAYYTETFKDHRHFSLASVVRWRSDITVQDIDAFQARHFDIKVFSALKIAAWKGSKSIFDAAFNCFFIMEDGKTNFKDIADRWHSILTDTFLSHKGNQNFVLYVIGKIFPQIEQLLELENTQEMRRSPERRDLSLSENPKAVNAKLHLARFYRMIIEQIPAVTKHSLPVLKRALELRKMCLRNDERRINYDDQETILHAQALCSAAQDKQYENLRYLLSLHPKGKALPPLANESLIDAIWRLSGHNQPVEAPDVACEVISTLPSFKEKLFAENPQLLLGLCHALARNKNWQAVDEYLSEDLLRLISLPDEKHETIRLDINPLLIILIEEDQIHLINRFLQASQAYFSMISLDILVQAMKKLLEHNQQELAIALSERSNAMQRLITYFGSFLAHTHQITNQRILRNLMKILISLAKGGNFDLTLEVLSNEKIRSYIDPETTLALYREAREKRHMPTLNLLLTTPPMNTQIAANDLEMREVLLESMDLEEGLIERFTTLWKLYDFEHITPSKETFRAVLQKALEQRGNAEFLRLVAHANLPQELRHDFEATIVEFDRARKQFVQNQITEQQCRLVVHSPHFNHFNPRNVERLLVITVNKGFNELTQTILSSRHLERFSLQRATEILVVSANDGQRGWLRTIINSNQFNLISSYDLWKAYQMAKAQNQMQAAEDLYTSSRGWDIFFENIWQTLLNIIFFWKTREIGQ